MEAGEQVPVEEAILKQVEEALLEDEVLKEQLRRRSEVYGLKEKTIADIVN